MELIETFFSKEEDLEEVAELIPNSTYFRSLRYKTEKSWSCERRVVTKVVYGNNGLKIRHVVTSLSAKKISPSKLYTNKYSPRGEMENRIKEPGQAQEKFSQNMLVKKNYNYTNSNCH